MLTSGRTFLLFTIVVAALCACNEEAPTPSERATPDEGLRLDAAVQKDAARIPLDAPDQECSPRIPIALLNSTTQLVRELVDPNSCESGWTALFDQFSQEGEEWQIPLQPIYVQRFEDVMGFAWDLQATARALRPMITTTRFSSSWPCFMVSEAIQNAYLNAVRLAQRPEEPGEKDSPGYTLELTLTHRDAYPIALHDNPEFGILGGWAHSNARDTFMTYVVRVIEVLGPELPAGSVIYLANEPTPELLDGYLNPEGKFPPGGRNAGVSLAIASINQRDAFIEAGARLRVAGFIPAIAVNIRPLTSDSAAPGAELLEYLHNWWLTDALVQGCIDNDFDGVCETNLDPVVDRLGVTYYGTMGAGETVAFGLPGQTPQLLAHRTFDFAPNAKLFRAALEETRTRYWKRIESSTLEFGVAEIGFSGSITDQVGWFGDYLAVAEATGADFLGVHAMFEHAEFGAGDWYFHWIDRCAPCERTDWGREGLETLRVFSNCN